MINDTKFAVQQPQTLLISQASLTGSKWLKWSLCVWRKSLTLLQNLP